MEKINKRVGFVATGDELVNGDIMNSNGQYFAQQLVEHGIQPGRQVVVSDDQQEIEQALHYMLRDHTSVITIGGLGPTEDDRTRFAVAAALDVELIFNTQAWQWIVTLMHSKGLDIPETNRQQALLPQGATAIHNPNGTAAACYLEHHGQAIFMLPGPPNECFPIFNTNVIPQLLQAQYAQQVYKQSWLLLGVSESKIAAQLEPLMPGSQCILGYRVHYPYLDIKLRATDNAALQRLSQQFSTILKPHVISTTHTTATQQLLQFLTTTHKPMTIIDQATHGLLEATLTSPTTQHHIHFCHEQHTRAQPQTLLVTITGLTDYWHGDSDPSKPLTLNLTLQYGTQVQKLQKSILNRGSKSITHAVEVICWELMRYLIAQA